MPVIVAVDDRAADLTLPMLNEMFEQPVNHMLTNRPGDRILRVSVTPDE